MGKYTAGLCFAAVSGSACFLSRIVSHYCSVRFFSCRFSKYMSFSDSWVYGRFRLWFMQWVKARRFVRRLRCFVVRRATVPCASALFCIFRGSFAYT